MYPVVDESVCVNCGACVKHCPVMTTPHSDGVQNVYASKYCDTQKTKESTSGGIFIPLAKSTLEKGGVVFGCTYDENLVAGLRSFLGKDFDNLITVDIVCQAQNFLKNTSATSAANSASL